MEQSGRPRYRNRRMALRLLAVVAAVALAGPAHGGGAKTACTPDAAKTLIHAFVRDYSAGRVAVINRMWAPEPRFRWFSSGKPGARLRAAAYVRSTLAGYFRSRVRVHERLRLTELRAGKDPARGIVDFSAASSCAAPTTSAALGRTTSRARPTAWPAGRR